MSSATGGGGGASAEGDLGRSIQLPENTDFRNISGAKIFAMDIGGSLTKIAYFSTMASKKILYNSEDVPRRNSPSTQIEVRDEAVYEVSEGARLHFIKFETVHFDHALEYISQSLMTKKHQDMMMQDIKVTGGGAYKFNDHIREKLGLPIEKCDEIPCIVQGCNFLLKNISDEVFLYQRKDRQEYKFQTINPHHMYPYLLVTIGSGVSIIKVDSDDKFERIGGTATGGGTFWGLGKLLTKAKTFDELLELAAHGDHRKVDMLVKDIYGESHEYGSLGLHAELIASSFGKAISAHDAFSDADVARSLLYMISNDIGQIASLYAMIKTIYFGGFFLRHNPVSMHTVSYSVNYWSKGEVQPLFLRHEGYLGAIGAFLKGAKACVSDDYSWKENLYGSSGFTNSNPRGGGGGFSQAVDHLEIDRSEQKLRFCPLLSNPHEYNPDTVDLTRDNDAREYWLQCLMDSLPKFTDRAIQSQEHSDTVQERAAKFQEQYLSRLHGFTANPFAFGNLTVRSLLDLREHYLLEFDFHDPYLKQKQYENDQAMIQLPARLAQLAELDWEERQRQLAYGLLAGNVFDWGAKEVALIMETKGLNFQEALNLVGPHPWLMDDLDAWIARTRESVHKCAAIFIDNSGVDVILGILPFVEDLLQRGTEVILCANNRPVLNDVTAAELKVLLKRASEHCPQIRQGLETRRLVCLDSGQSSPCLDLTKLNQEVIDAMLERKVDLLVLEGMGRAVHTNLFAKFNCECLKVAVLKNRWLANKLGGEMYAVIFKYDRPNAQDQ